MNAHKKLALEALGAVVVVGLLFTAYEASAKWQSRRMQMDEDADVLGYTLAPTDD